MIYGFVKESKGRFFFPLRWTRSSSTVKAPPEQKRQVFKSIRLTAGWKISALLFLPSDYEGFSRVNKVLVAGEGMCVCACVCWVMTGGMTGCLCSGLLFHSATTNEPQRPITMREEMFVWCVWMWSAHASVRLQLCDVNVVVCGECVSVYSWRSKLPPLIAERRRGLWTWDD